MSTKTVTDSLLSTSVEHDDSLSRRLEKINQATTLFLSKHIDILPKNEITAYREEINSKKQNVSKPDDTRTLNRLVDEYKKSIQANSTLANMVSNLQSINAELALYTQGLLLRLAQYDDKDIPQPSTSLMNSASSILQYSSQKTLPKTSDLSLHNDQNIPSSTPLFGDEDESDLELSSFYKPEDLEYNTKHYLHKDTHGDINSSLKNPSNISSNTKNIDDIPSSDSLSDLTTPHKSEQTPVPDKLVKPTPVSQAFLDTFSNFYPLLPNNSDTIKDNTFSQPQNSMFTVDCACCDVLHKLLRGTSIPVESKGNISTQATAHSHNTDNLDESANINTSLDIPKQLDTSLNDSYHNQPKSLEKIYDSTVDLSVPALDVSAIDPSLSMLAPSVYGGRTQSQIDLAFDKITSSKSTGNNSSFISPIVEMKRVWEAAERSFASRFMKVYEDATLFDNANLDDDVENLSTYNSLPNNFICSKCNQKEMNTTRQLQLKNEDFMTLDTCKDHDRSNKHSTLKFALWVVMMSALAVDMFTRTRTTPIEFFPM